MNEKAINSIIEEAKKAGKEISREDAIKSLNDADLEKVTGGKSDSNELPKIRI